MMETGDTNPAAPDDVAYWGEDTLAKPTSLERKKASSEDNPMDMYRLSGFGM